MELTASQKAKIVKLLILNYYEKCKADVTKNYEHQAWVRGNIAGITETLEKLGLNPQEFISAANKTCTAETMVQKL